MDELRMRRAAPADLDIVLRHRREMFRDMNSMGDFETADALSSEFFRRALAQADYHGWLLEDPAGNVAAGGGIILIDFHPSPMDPRRQRPWVVNVYVEHAWRRRGLARRLMDEMIKWSQAQGYRNLFLHASEAARPLYHLLGFVATNEMRLKL